MQPGDIPSVVALSWGKGDPHKDVITVVYIDQAGRLREHTRLDNLTDSEFRDEFIDLLKRRAPDVIVIGGFSVATTDLTQQVKSVIGETPPQPSDEPPASTWGESSPTTESLKIPVIYVFDEVARMYQHSKRAQDEFSALSPVAKYCVGLARYTQSPLNEYAALGVDITMISYDEENQQLVRTVVFNLCHKVIDETL